MKSACAIVVAYRCPDDVSALLERLSGALPVRICDNGGDIDDLPEATVLRPPRNLGFAAGVNLAARGVSESFLLVVNPDADIDAERAERLIEVAAEHPQLAAVGPQLEYPDGSPQINGGRFSGLAAEVSRALGIGRHLRPLRARLRAEARDPTPRLIDRDWISGAVMVLRREAFEAVDGFDEGYEMYFEDEDLCRRLRRAGGRCAIFTGVTVAHAVGGSSASRDPYRSDLYRRSRARYHRTHSRGLTAALALWSMRRPEP